MILDVARSALRVGYQGVERSLAFEFAQDRRVRASDGMGQHVQTPSMGDTDHDLVRAASGGQLDRLVEHRHERVETLDRELLLPDERAPQKGLECLDLCQPLEECQPFLRRQRLAEATRFDRPAEPDALGVVRDVLDLVGDRPHVDVLQPRQRVTQGLSFHRKAQESGGNLRLKLGGQRRAQALGLERGVARRLRAERVEVSGKMPVHANRLHERHRGRDRRQQLVAHGCFRRGRRSRRGRRHGGCRQLRLLGNGRRGVRCQATVTVLRARLDQPGEPRQRGEDAIVRALEHTAPRGIDGLRVLQILLEERPDVAGVQVARHQARRARCRW